MRHIEFIDNDHFENKYHRVSPAPRLRQFIDFFWETKFDHLWKVYPKGFSDAQFPNIGYTYIFNLGTPYIMQVEDKKFSMKTDCFLPRYNTIECFHKPGNHLFGIKFRISPVIFEKKVNFSEYRGAVFPLSYLIDNQIGNEVKKAPTFNERVHILTKYYEGMLNKHEDSFKTVVIVSQVLDKADRDNNFDLSLETEADLRKISTRTLLRYFETCTGIPGKKALQVMRIRKAIAHIMRSPATFDLTEYGYHDQSHFYKHLKKFLGQSPGDLPESYLRVLSTLQQNRRNNSP